LDGQTDGRTAAMTAIMRDTACWLLRIKNKLNNYGRIKFIEETMQQAFVCCQNGSQQFSHGVISGQVALQT